MIKQTNKTGTDEAQPGCKSKMERVLEEIIRAH